MFLDEALAQKTALLRVKLPPSSRLRRISFGGQTSPVFKLINYYAKIIASFKSGLPDEALAKSGGGGGSRIRA
jgi:hypothetical protein